MGKMVTRSKGMRAALALAILAFVAACAATYTNHGYAPTDAELENIIVAPATGNFLTLTVLVGRKNDPGVVVIPAQFGQIEVNLNTGVAR